MVLESTTYDLTKVSSETFNPMEIENLPKSANEHLKVSQEFPKKLLFFQSPPD